LARPGGNVTGLSSQATDLGAKRLGLLHEAIPRIRRLAIMTNVANPAAALIGATRTRTRAKRDRSFLLPRSRHWQPSRCRRDAGGDRQELRSRYKHHQPTLGRSWSHQAIDAEGSLGIHATLVAARQRRTVQRIKAALVGMLGSLPDRECVYRHRAAR